MDKGQVVALKQAEWGRVRVLERVVAGELTLAAAARLLGKSLRQARRWLRRFEANGVAGMAHAGRGRPAPNRLPAGLRRRIFELVEKTYRGFNDCHLAEVLAAREGIPIARSTLRRLLREQGYLPKRRRRPRQHRRRREPAAREGLLVQWDGSPHRWLGQPGPEWTLMAALDDANTRLLDAFFVPAETSLAYLLLLRGIVLNAGIPVAIYHDRHSALVRSDGHWSLQEQLAGEQEPTQVGAALRDLGIRSIPAHSPQAKGRIERFFGIAQDRLVAELQLHGITTLEQANSYLRTRWLPHYRQRFGRSTKLPHSAYRSPHGLDLDKILAFRYTRTVAADNTVTLGSLTLHIPPGPRNRSYAKTRVDLRQHLDGSWSVYYQARRLAQHPPTPLAEPQRLRVKTRHLRPAKGADEVLFVYLPETSNPIQNLRLQPDFPSPSP